MPNEPGIAVAANENSFLDAFERAWQAGKAPSIRGFLAKCQNDGQEASPNESLLELVIVDLWHRWRRASSTAETAASGSASSVAGPQKTIDSFPARPLLEDYVKAFPELGPSNQLPLDAIVEEYRARLQWSSGCGRGRLPRAVPCPSRRTAGSRLVAVREEMNQAASADAQGSKEKSPLDPSATNLFVHDRSTLLGSRFRILRPHAKGGLGQVSVARDEELQREVALKEIQDRHADNPYSRARFLLEAEITGGLEHPGIVPVYGLGQYADGRPYYAMRFIRGDSLKEAIDHFHGNGEEATRSRRTGRGAPQAAGPLPRCLQRHRLRPQPGRAAPRPEAGQHHAGKVRRNAGGRLGPGQAAWTRRRPTWSLRGTVHAPPRAAARCRRRWARPWARRST